jgi:hypothetical protein
VIEFSVNKTETEDLNMMGRRGSRNDLINMHELDDEFTNFLQGIVYVLIF